jgi:hypothetical protein
MHLVLFCILVKEIEQTIIHNKLSLLKIILTILHFNPAAIIVVVK